MNNTPIAFFDFDGTLTTRDTLMPFLKFVVGKPKYYWNLLLVSPVLVGYFLKLVRNDIAKETVLKRYLSGYSINELFSLGERFSTEAIPAMWRSEGIQRLRWHQEQGHDCVLVSASFDIWLKFVGERLNISHVISSQLYVKSKRVDGHIKGLNCYGKEKAERIKAWIKAEGRKPSVTYAYGDSSGDTEMLNIVDEGFIIKSRKDFIKYS
ncbi:MAG: HAD-IB family hydrolase [Desulfuromonadaceae bacterium]|nr:HAD-IB family hydrolase [Desulfuromonadaceae bacterium]